MTNPEPGTTLSQKPQPIAPGVARAVKPIMKVMSRLNVWVYRASNGRVFGKFPGGSGADICLVTMLGKRSGKEITIPLIHLPHGDDVILVASQGGMEKHPAWYYSVSANPNVSVQFHDQVRDMQARRATDEEKRALWPHLRSIYPDFEEYQARTERNIPVFICSPV
jgi:deazaflavin-dependent oxidoreductase (nitroreductase family)